MHSHSRTLTFVRTCSSPIVGGNDSVFIYCEFHRDSWKIFFWPGLPLCDAFSLSFVATVMLCARLLNWNEVSIQWSACGHNQFFIQTCFWKCIKGGFVELAYRKYEYRTRRMEFRYIMGETMVLVFSKDLKTNRSQCTSTKGAAGSSIDKMKKKLIENAKFFKKCYETGLNLE